MDDVAPSPSQGSAIKHLVRHSKLSTLTRTVLKVKQRQLNVCYTSKAEESGGLNHSNSRGNVTAKPLQCKINGSLNSQRHY